MIGINRRYLQQYVEVATLLERVRNAKEHIQIGIDAEDYYRIKESEKVENR